MKTEMRTIGNRFSALAAHAGIGFLLLLVLMNHEAELNIQNTYLIGCSIFITVSAFLAILFSNVQIRFNIIDILAFVFFGYLTFNYMGISPVDVSTKYLNAIYLLLLYFAVKIIFSGRRDLIWLAFAVIVIGGGIEAFIGLKQAIGLGYSRHWLYNITGTFFNPGPYGGYLAIIMVLALAYLVRYYNICSAWIKKIVSSPRFLIAKPEIYLYLLCCITFILAFVIFFATMSRAAIIAFVVSATIIALKQKNLRRRLFHIIKSAHRGRFLWMLAGGICMVIVFSIFLYYKKQDSANGRLHIWHMTSQVIANAPVLGRGFGSFASEYAIAQRDYFQANPESPAIAVAGSPEYNFNEYLGLWAETGLLGLLLFLAVTGIAAYVLLRRNHPFVYGLLSLLIFALFSYPFSLIPFQVLLVIFLSSASTLYRTENGKMECSRRIYLLLASFVAVVSATGLSYVYDEKIKAVKIWREITSLYKSEHYDIVIHEYGLLYPVLKDNSRFLFEYGHSLHKTGNNRDSNSILKEGLALSADPMFYNIIGKNYQVTGEYDLAEKYFWNAYYLLPNRLYPLYLLMLLHEEAGNNGEAVRIARLIVDFNPKIRSSATDTMQQSARKLLEDTGSDM